MLKDADQIQGCQASETRLAMQIHIQVSFVHKCALKTWKNPIYTIL